MPTMSHSMPIKVRREARDRATRRRAFLASLALHLVVVAALVMFARSESLPQPQDEEAISVELVPPPEPPKDPKPAPDKPAPDKPAPDPKPAPVPVLQPVVQFGEKDAGPKVSPEGGSATEASASPTPPRDADKDGQAQPPAALPVKATDEASQPVTDGSPALMPADPAKAQKAPTLRKAKTLFSRSATGDSIAMIAMRNDPRDLRIARLCATELKEQLLHASPSYFAEIVPFERLKEGTVVESDSSAFRSNWEWYHLSYRCEVDADAMRVVSFAFDIGDRLTPEEWRRRRLPSD
jgi:hypothetical protein